MSLFTHLTVAIAIWSSCLGSVQDKERAAVLVGLSGEKPSDRANAVLQVEQTQGLLRNRDVQRALVMLLHRENDYIGQRYLSGEGVDEAFSAYYDHLLALVLNGVGLSDQAALAAVVEASYNPESAIAERIAAIGSAAVPIVVGHLSTTRVDPNRWNCLAVLGRILHRDSTPGQVARLESHHREAAFEAVLAAAHNSEVVTRRYAARALGMAKDERALPVLERLLQTDPDDGSGRSPSLKLSVRDEARRALEAIRAARK